MSLRAKLATTIAALCMVICLLTVGVWAASQTTVNIDGSVSFVANDVHATVTLTSTGAKTTVNKSVTFNSDANAAEGENKTEVENWDTADLDLDFEKKGVDIVLEIKVDNLSTERTLTAAVAVDDPAEGSNITVTVDGEASATVAKATDASTPGTATLKVKIHVVDSNKQVDKAAYGITVTLTDEKA